MQVYNAERQNSGTVKLSKMSVIVVASLVKRDLGNVGFHLVESLRELRNPSSTLLALRLLPFNVINTIDIDTGCSPFAFWQYWC